MKNIGNVANIVSECAIKHSTARWVTLQKILVELIEPPENMKGCF